jgi:hypothetical protein
MAKTTEYAWLIEQTPYYGDKPEYLSITASSYSPPTGKFAWTKSHIHALRFARKIDADLFIIALTDITRHLPCKISTRGFRGDEFVPVSVEHGWDIETADSMGD